jgi:DNA-binding transcriptional regulator YhcF (GntR family)
MRFLSVKMSLSELQRRNLIVKFWLENPNKNKSETVEHFKLLEFKTPTINRTIKRFEKQEKVEKKIGSGKICALSLSKIRVALKKQTAGRNVKSYRELGWKIQVHHNTVKKYLTKMGNHRKAKKP